MSDIFEQIDEQMEADRVQKFWEENRKWIIGGLILFFLGLFAYVGWRDYRERQDQSASDIFMVAPPLLKKGDLQAGQKQLDLLLKEYPNHGYALMARLLDARALAEKGKTEAAVQQLDRVANEAGSSPMQGLALLNAAYLTAKDTKKSESFLKRIGPNSAYYAHALELMGLLAAASGDEKTALAHYQEAKKANPDPSLEGRLGQRLERLGIEVKK